MPNLFEMRFRNKPKEVPYLTFSSPSSFTLNTQYGIKSDGTVEYSTDKNNWTVWNGNSAISSVNNELYLRGSNNTFFTNKNNLRQPTTFQITGSDVSCNGNIENLLDWQTVARGEHPVIAERCFSSLFTGCTALITAPRIPIPTLTTYCYYNMFYNTSIVVAPELPAMNLAPNCYHAMFSNCKKIEIAPKLPAKIMASECYRDMFYYATSLTTVPELPATTLASGCYSEMFYGCSSLKFSETQTGTSPYEFKFGAKPSSTYASSMLYGTRGTFTGVPTKQVYYVNYPTV